MSHLVSAAETLVITAAALRFNVVVATYKLNGDVPEAVQAHHKALLKADGYRDIAAAYEAALALCPRHPKAAEWRAHMASAADNVLFYENKVSYWTDRL